MCRRTAFDFRCSVAVEQDQSISPKHRTSLAIKDRSRKCSLIFTIHDSSN